MSTGSGKRPDDGMATIDDLLQLPEEDRYELVDGELVPKEAASGRHGRAQARLSARLDPFDRRTGGPGELGGWWFATEALVDFGVRQKRRPDVAGWRRERLPMPPAEVPIVVIPDWICEIVSASNASTDTLVKMNLYHQARVPHNWLLDPRDETLTVYRHTPEGYLRVTGAGRGERLRAEPFEAIELSISAFFGDD